MHDFMMVSKWYVNIVIYTGNANISIAVTASQYTYAIDQTEDSLLFKDN